MKNIFIDITGVLRDTYTKFTQEYRKYYLDLDPEEETDDDFQYGVNLPITSTDLMYHFNFNDEKELDYFQHKEFSMEIFGHAAPVYMGVFNDLHQLFNEQTDYDFTIVSNEIGKSRSSSLFFLAKNACLLTKYEFYKDIDCMWERCDIWVTSDPTIIQKKPTDKKVIIIEKEYNKNNEGDIKVEKLSDLLEHKIWSET